MRRRRGTGAGGGMLAFLAAAALAAQDAPEDAAERARQLVELVRALEEGSNGVPSVLEGIDPRTASAEEKKIARTLRETRVDLVIEKRDLPSTVALLRDLTGLNFVISGKAREAIEAEKPAVTLSLRGLTAENILNLLALQLGEYRFAVRYGAVMLIRKEEHRPRQITRIYPVADLVRPRPDFPAPRLALRSLDEKP